MSSKADPDRTQTRAAARKKPRAPDQAVLRVIHPPDVSWRMRIGAGRTVVGRAPGDASTRALSHDTVSRAHFAVDWDSRKREHVGVDMGSHNGTRIDGASCTTPTSLRDGTVIQLGDVLLVFEADEATETGAVRERARQNIPGEAAAMQALRARVARAAPDPSPVLLLGETGTGKEWVAREIHLSSGRSGPLIEINCSALSPQIIDSQLFGHVRGAFTGATGDSDGLFRSADGGTLFLDEIGELPGALQPKLLRVLQEGRFQPVGSTKTVTVDVRVVAATNRELEAEVESGAFRRDLYARLALWAIQMPPLRERRGDILQWVERMHARWMEKRPDATTEPLRFTPDAAEALTLAHWPDNLRGVDRMVHELSDFAARGDEVGVDELPKWIGIARDDGSAAPVAAATPSAPQTKPPVPTRDEFVAVFEQLDGNIRAIARHFSRDRRQIYRWLEAHGLSKIGDK